MLAKPLRKRLLTLLGASLLLVVSGGVFAQDAPETPPEPEDTPADIDEVEVPMRKQAEISPSDMVSQAADLIAKMQDVLTRVVQLQETARKQKDVIKLNCVNDKLLQIKQLLNIAEGARTEMQESIARQDEEGRYHQFSRITISHQQVTVLGAEAENCIGEDLTFLGPTEVTVEEPEEPEDPTETEEPDFPEVQPPPVPSPFV